MTAESVLERSPLFFDALRSQLEDDVRGAVLILKDLGFGFDEERRPNQCMPVEKVQLPAAFVLGLFIGVRFHRWELDGIAVHIEAGLPSSDALLTKLLREYSGPDLAAYVKDLSCTARRLFQEHFLWSGRDDIEADVAVIAELDEEYLNRFADFIWEHRHLLRAAGGNN